MLPAEDGLVLDYLSSAQNSIDNVFFTNANEAVIFVKSSDGTSPVMASLSNLAAWRADGTISNDDQLRREWLRLDR